MKIKNFERALSLILKCKFGEDVPEELLGKFVELLMGNTVTAQKPELPIVKKLDSDGNSVPKGLFVPKEIFVIKKYTREEINTKWKKLIEDFSKIYSSAMSDYEITSTFGKMCPDLNRPLYKEYGREKLNEILVSGIKKNM